MEAFRERFNIMGQQIQESAGKLKEKFTYSKDKYKELN